ncbi:MAG TPA: HD domain-containing protein [Planctomycetaceae bacterium]|jgi:phosphonate degradation associated HDIG domain protein|nr:HD domain-containing protein [Planctomycetaceae bacterium]
MISEARFDPLIQEIAKLFARRGREMYAGEPVTQTEHALQAAFQAEQSGADAALITAALLHDVGHLLHDLDEDCAEEGIDDKHEALGAEWLSQHFGFEVVEPVRLHVAAKRYLCAVDQEYYDRLSDASRLSLRLQGGPFTPTQARKFEQHPCFAAAIKLRRWDEEAKIPQLPTPPLEQYLSYARTVVSPRDCAGEATS